MSPFPSKVTKTTSYAAANRRIRAFKRWMRANGVDCSDALHIVTSNGGGDISVRALCRLNEGDVVAAIPKLACITARTSGARDIIDCAELGGPLALAIAVMFERSLGTTSAWYGYLQLLPEYECTPLVWSDEEIDQLLIGTELHKTIKEDKSLVYEDWKEVIYPIIQSCPELDPNDFSPEKYFSAKTLVSSRSFQIDDYHGSGMVPLADLFNHKTNAENLHFTSTTSSSSSENENDTDASGDDASSVVDATSSSSGVDDPATLEMIVVREVEAGDEVFNTYGSMGNAALLHRYGFTEPENPYDIVNIDLDLVQEWCSTCFSNRYIRSRLSLWRKLDYTGCVSQNSEYFEITSDGEPQPELIVLLYIIFLEEHNFEKLKCMVDSLKEANEDTKIIKLRRITGSNSEKEPDGLIEPLLTGLVCKALVGLASLRENLYGPNSLQDDVNRLSKCCPVRDRKMYHSLILRISERKTIRRLRSYALKSSANKKSKSRRSK